MTSELYLKQEFFDEFKGYPKKDLALVVYNLSKTRYKALMHFYSLASPYNLDTRTARDVIRAVRQELNKIYKIKLQEEFPQVSKGILYDIVYYLEDNLKTALFKKYTLKSKKERIEELTPKDKLLISDALNEIRKIAQINLGKREYTYKYLFSLFDLKDKESVLLILKYIFKEDELKLMQKKYGIDYTNTSFVKELTNEENSKIHMQLIPKIKTNIEKIANGYEFLTIEEVYPNIPKDILYFRIESLEKEEKNKIYDLFKKDLQGKFLIDRSKINEVFPKKINDKINQVKKKLSKKEKPTPIKPFYEIFEQYKKTNENDEEFKKRINSFITRKQLDKLSRKYGYDLKKCVNDGSYTPEEDKYIMKIIIPTIKLRIKRTEEGLVKKKVPTLLEKQPIYVTEDDLNYAISLCTQYEQSLIRKKDDMNKNKNTFCGEFTQVELYTLKLVLEKVQRRVFENKKSLSNISITNLKRIQEFTKTEEFNSLIEMYEPLLALAVMIKIHMSYISIDSISKLTGIDEERIITCSKEYLEQMKEKLNKDISKKVLG